MHEQFQIEAEVKTYLAIMLLPLIFLNWIRNLKWLSPVMSVANLCMSVGLGIIFYYIFQDMKPIAERDNFHVFFAHWETLPLYFGTALYAFEGIGMVKFPNTLIYLLNAAFRILIRDVYFALCRFYPWKIK